MSARQTIRRLLADAQAAAEPTAGLDPNVPEHARKLARIAWARETMARLRAAQARVDDAWDRLIDAHEHLDDDELEELPEPPEQAELDAIHAQIDDVIERDKWPRELYWGSI